jgi:hypothetical protein
MSKSKKSTKKARPASQPVALAQRLVAYDPTLRRYFRHASEIIADIGILNIHADAMGEIYEALPKNTAERNVSNVCQQIVEHATDRETRDLASTLDDEIVSALNDERDRAYLLGLAVGLQVVNAGKDGAR